MLEKHSSVACNLALHGKRSLKPARLFGICAVLLLAGSGPLLAQSQFEEDFDDKDKPWVEVAIQLPAAPKPENLLPFYVSQIATQSFAIDANSLTLGADGVIRYTLLATSESGAKNISYEGIRCASYEKKLYAFGRPDGTWSRSRRDQWERIAANAANRQHAALFKDYFCRELTVAGSAKEILDSLRYKKPLSPHN
jgi:hypothetical protein